MKSLEDIFFEKLFLKIQKGELKIEACIALVERVLKRRLKDVEKDLFRTYYLAIQNGEMGFEDYWARYQKYKPLLIKRF
jgi:hypothetical protein